MTSTQLYKWLVTLLCVLLLQLAAYSQVSKAEYFFDTDPGFGAATAVSITPGTDVAFTFSPSVSALSNGLHRLLVRTQQADGKWSVSQQQLLYKEALNTAALPNITRLEWFADTDPGVGSGTAVTILPTADSTLTFVAPVTALPAGLHRIFIRAQDNGGNWSLAAQQLFYREAVVNNPSFNITKAEYFIDADPGFGSATDVALTAGTDISFSFNPSVAAISNGLHQLYVRTQDAAGKWSLSSRQLFYKEAVVNNAATNVVKAEYFIDADPGFGSAIDVPMTAGADVTFGLSAGIGALPNGLHRLFVRTKDAAGLWSLSAQQLFYKEAVVSSPSINITKAEYFFDTDPGFGLATDAPLTAGTDISFAVTASVNALTNGLHRMFVRTQDATGKWSLSNQQLIYKEAVIASPSINLTKAEYFFDTDPGFGAATNIAISPGADITFTFNGDFSALTNGLHHLFVRTQDANGRWSISTQQLFYKEPLIAQPLVNITQAEFYFDADPGFGSASAITLTPGQDILIPFTGSISGLGKGLHRLFVRTKDANGLWSITAQQLFYKEVVATDPITPLVTLEYFWDTDPGFSRATKVTMPTNSGEVTDFVFSVATPASLSNAKHNLFVRTIDATDYSLTTVKQFDFTNIALPVSLLQFAAHAVQEKVAVQWTTTNEVNNKQFEVERSTDGARFIRLGVVAARGVAGTQTVYDFMDESPAVGMNYYRLKQVDKDGNFKYSPVVAIRFDKGGAMVKLFPNPAITQFTVQSDVRFTKVLLSAADGRVVQQWAATAGNQYLLGNVAAGMYVVQLVGADGQVVSKSLLIARR